MRIVFGIAVLLVGFALFAAGPIGIGVGIFLIYGAYSILRNK